MVKAKREVDFVARIEAKAAFFSWNEGAFSTRTWYEDRIEQISDEKYSYFQRVKDTEAKLREALEAIEDFQVEITKAQIREEELQSGILILQELIKQTKNNNFAGLKEQRNHLNNVAGLQQENTINTLPKISILMSLLEETVKERDDIKAKLVKALKKVDQLSYEADLSQQNNEQILKINSATNKLQKIPQ